MANQVLVVMGSDSDWPIMKNCIEILEMFAVHYEVQIASAHRTPERALQLAKEAVKLGTIAGRVVLIAGVWPVALYRYWCPFRRLLWR